MSPTAEPRACVIGWPIAHSRSPIIHGYWLEQLGLKGSYRAVALSPPDFPAFIENLAANGFTGANVTLPHKQKAFELAGVRTPVAERLAAVNTLWLKGGALCGDNTDGAGFLAALDQDAPGWERPPGGAVVLGAGGGARAIVDALLQRGKTVRLANRTMFRAQTLAEQFGAGVEVVEWARLPAALEGACLLVNATSLGMKGQPPLDLDLSNLPAHAVVNDIVYFPLQTGLLRQARALGLRTVSGIAMLLHQAAPGFERWFGVRPVVTANLRRLVEADILQSL